MLAVVVLVLQPLQLLVLEVQAEAVLVVQTLETEQQELQIQEVAVVHQVLEMLERQYLQALEVQELLLFPMLVHKEVLAELLHHQAATPSIHLQLVVHIRLNKGDSNGPFCKSSRRQSHSGDRSRTRVF
jgi:hypothetical protein